MSTVAFLSVFMVALILLKVGEVVGVRLGYVDVPAGRKQHEAPTPVIGGLFMCGAFLLALLFFSCDWPLSIVVGMVLMALLGGLEDLQK